ETSLQMFIVISVPSRGRTVMLEKYGRLAVLLVWACSFSPCVAADAHRILVLDAVKAFGSPSARLSVIEIESGKVISRVDVGANPEIGLSQKGNEVAVVTDNTVGGIAQPHSRLEIYRTSDLNRLQTGLFPFVGRGGFADYAREPTLFF